MSGLLAAAGAGAVGAAGFVASARVIGPVWGAALLTAGGWSMRGPLAGDADGWRAASSAAAATTQTAPTTIVRELIVQGESIGFFAPAAFFDRIDRERFDFVRRSESFFSDIF